MHLLDLEAAAPFIEEVPLVHHELVFVDARLEIAQSEPRRRVVERPAVRRGYRKETSAAPIAPRTREQHGDFTPIERFEVAVKAKGWLVFTTLDHAAAAAKVGLQLQPRTVIVYGNPKLGTGPMQKAPGLAIDNPPKALVWQDDHGKVWLTYNTADYIAHHVYPRLGLTLSDEGRKQFEEFLDAVTDQATK